MKSASRYKCVIIDDDDNGTELLKEYLQAVPKLSLLESFSDPSLAVRAIKNNQQVDFLFLDINMRISGVDIARILRDDVRFIVFVTRTSRTCTRCFLGKR